MSADVFEEQETDEQEIGVHETGVKDTGEQESADVEWQGAVAGVEGSGSARARRRRRLRTLTGVGAVTAVAVAGGAVAVGVGGSTASPSTHSSLPPATATVVRTTLTETEKVNGTLGYGATTTVNARGGGGAGSGTVTWLPSLGDVVTQGKPVYRVDDEPVTLLYGVLPLFRTLQTGETGADVKEFETDLAALGYTGFTAGDSFTADTAAAVKKWQADLGLDQTGTVDPGQVAVAAGPLRIAALRAELGGAATGPVLDYTGTTRLVTVALDVAKEGLVKAGDQVTVTLPDGSTAAATVSSVGKVATKPADGGGGGGSGGSGTTTVDVDIALTDPTAGGALDAAPVDVSIVSGQAKDVLAVPVSALEALAEGGYGVQVVDGAGTRYVAVKTGLFADGRVEVSGDGIAAGTAVGVPSE